MGDVSILEHVFPLTVTGRAYYRSYMKASLALSASRAFLIIIPLFFAIFSLSPRFAAADTATVQTGQILPQGGNTCQTLQILDVAPHVYDGTLQSLDVTIADPSYVAVTGTVGETPVSFASMSRWQSSQGLRIHVDTPTTAVRTGLPVTITLISARTGSPVCVSVISLAVETKGAQLPVTPIPQPVSHETSANPNSHHPVVKGVVSATQNHAGTPGVHAVAAKPAVTASLSQRVAKVCEGSNAYRLWFVLLLVYLIVVATIAFAEPWFLKRSALATVAAILVPLLLLLGFWYLSTSCRAALWIPLLAFLIAILGLLAAFWNHPESV